MRDLAESVFGSSVEYIRNPCNCYDDLGDADPSGGGIEVHTQQELSSSAPVVGFSLDGIGYSLPFENGIPGPGMDAVEDLMEIALARRLLYFGLWRHDRQGVVFGREVHPNERTYAIPSDRSKRFEIELLRFGLLEEDEIPAEP